MGKYRAEIVKNVRKVVDFNFAENTTYGLGGKAKAAYFPESVEQLKEVYDVLSASNEKFVVLGCGSNVLVSDDGFDGCVIVTKRLNNITVKENAIYCDCGVTVASLLKFCLNNGFGGFEYLAGIPATLGGLALMNGGIAYRHIGEDIASVEFYNGNLSEIYNKNCNFGNKHSIMRDINGVIVGVNLSKNAVPREAVAQKIEYFLNKRRALPRGKSCGCIFKNFSDINAGKLIDEAGLKGLSSGGAHVSREHANFIINDGGTAADVFSLISVVKNRVFEKFGVVLDEEVVYIGEFDETYS